MKILGVSANYHDSSAALLVDGEVVASAAEERFSLNKHDPGMPHEAIDFCLSSAKIRGDELDYVAYYENPHVKFSRKMAAAFADFPRSLRAFVRSSREAVTSGFWIKNALSKRLDVVHDRIVFVPHHLSHAAHAFHGSGFQEAAVLTVDAVGEWAATALFRAKWSPDSGYRLEPLEAFGYPNSIGLVYSAFTAFLGFEVNDGECSTMALAAFGKPRYRDEVSKVLRLGPEGDYSVDLSFFDFHREDRPPFSRKLIELFGEPRSPGAPLGFSSFEEPAVAGADQQRYADIAASVQAATEDAVLALAHRARRLTGSRKLCYSGGVALNCVANSRIVSARLFDSVFVPPDPGDGGGAAGAALYLAGRLGDKGPPRVTGPFLGKDCSSSALREMAPHLNTRGWRVPVSRGDVEFRELPENELLDYVAARIHQGDIVGWVQGRFENGPRALGHRSLLCKPDDVAVARKLGEKVKSRAAFRPFACSITREEARRSFEEAGGSGLEAWMQSCFRVRRDALPRLRAACHVDGTTRAQICDPEDDPRFHALLLKYARLSGIGALLNTSFNERGYPMVAGPMEALLSFARTEIDVLVVDRFVIVKGPCPARD